MKVNALSQQRLGGILHGLLLSSIAMASGFWLYSHRGKAEPVPTGAAEPAAARHAQPALARPVPIVPATAGPENYSNVPRHSGSPGEIFSRWASDFVKMENAETKPELLREGERLAAERRDFLKQQIQSDPRGALANSLGYELYRRMPEPIRAQLEERVSGRGDFEVYAALPLPGREAEVKPLSRYVQAGGRRYEAFVYGRRTEQITTRNAALHGIALDGLMAVHESPVRVLEPGEPPAPGKTLHPLDPVSGRAAAAVEEGILVEVGDDIFVVAAAHFESFEQEVSAQETPDPVGYESIGEKKVLVMRVQFPDFAGESVSEEEAYSNMAAVSEYFAGTSFGMLSFVATVTPLLTLPESTNIYRMNTNLLQRHAREAAAAAGFITNDYPHDIVTFKGIGYPWGGFGLIGNKGSWMQGGLSIGTTAHELGHNLGLGHAKAWIPSGASPIGSGSAAEYGNPFDMMGNTGSFFPHNHVNAWSKHRLGWIPSTGVHFLDQPGGGTYRIYRFDHLGPVNPDHRYLIRIATGLTNREALNRFFQIDYRRGIEHPFLAGGVCVKWSSLGTVTYLLDLTPGSSLGMEDSALQLGQTLSDPELGLHITPIAKGGESPEEYMDVVVHAFLSGENQPPAIEFSAPAYFQARTPLPLSATGSDPDGDPLVYHWHFGDELPSQSGGNITYAWIVGGERSITVTASDMKGGTATQTLNIMVEDPLTAWSDHSVPPAAQFSGIAYGAGRFVAASSNLNQSVWASPDGSVWSSQPGWTDTSLNTVRHLKGLFVAAGRVVDPRLGGTTGAIFVSTDGLSWTAAKLPDGNPLHAVAFGKDLWVAAGEAGTILTSADGTNWTARSSGSSAALYALAFGNGLFVAAGEHGTILSSFNGIDWEARPAVTAQKISDLVFGQGRFVGVAGTRMVVSNDGVDWVQLAPPGLSGAEGIAWGENVFVMTASLRTDDSLKHRLLASMNGLEWAWLPGFESPHPLRALAFGENSFVAAGLNGALFKSGLFEPSLPGGMLTFEQWAALMNLPPNANGPMHDASNDGMANLLAFALGLNPLENATDGLPFGGIVAVDGANHFALFFTRSLTAAGVTFQLMKSEDLSNWTETEAALESIELLSANETAMVRLRELAETGMEIAQFYRLAVTLQ